MRRGGREGEKEVSWFLTKINSMVRYGFRDFSRRVKIPKSANYKFGLHVIFFHFLEEVYCYCCAPSPYCEAGGFNNTKIVEKR